METRKIIDRYGNKYLVYIINCSYVMCYLITYGYKRRRNFYLQLFIYYNYINHCFLRVIKIYTKIYLDVKKTHTHTDKNIGHIFSNIFCRIYL